MKLCNYAFCDWITISQQHDVEKINLDPSETIYQVIDRQTGDIQISKNNPIQHVGSHDTSIRIQVNNGRVSLSGNVGRFGRPDNLFGYTLDTVKQKTNEILQSVELPPFTAGKYIHVDETRQSRVIYTGAKVSRLDITTNFKLGKYCRKYLHWISTQQPNRTKSQTYGDGQTTYFRTGLKTTKFYNKSDSIRRDNKNSLRYLKDLAEFCEDQGIVRHETTFNEKYLNRHGLKPYTSCTTKNINDHYQIEIDKIRGHIDMNTKLEDLPLSVRGTYHSYLSGENITQMPKSTFYRHRNQLLKIGVDIAAPLNAVTLKIQPQYIKFDQVEIPSFYKAA